MTINHQQKISPADCARASKFQSRRRPHNAVHFAKAYAKTGLRVAHIAHGPCAILFVAMNLPEFSVNICETEIDHRRLAVYGLGD
jgi:hypothetical protein